MLIIDDRIQECGIKFRRSVLKNKVHSSNVHRHRIAVWTKDKLILFEEATVRADEILTLRQDIASLKEIIRSARAEIMDI